MRKIQLNSSIKIYTILFVVLYALVWLMPSFIIVPIDHIIDSIRGFKSVDGWTNGVMAWVGFLVVIPVIYLTLIFVSLKQKRG